MKETIMTYLRPEPYPVVARPLLPNLPAPAVLQPQFEGEDSPERRLIGRPSDRASDQANI